MCLCGVLAFRKHGVYKSAMTDKLLLSLWKNVQQAAVAFAESPDAAANKKLHETCLAYVAVKCPPEEPIILPFGRSKGKTLKKGATDDLEWMVDRLKESVADETKSKWKENNEVLLAAIQAELATR
jgi:hypothetical protein